MRVTSWGVNVQFDKTPERAAKLVAMAGRMPDIDGAYEPDDDDVNQGTWIFGWEGIPTEQEAEEMFLDLDVDEYSVCTYPLDMEEEK